MRHNKAGRRLGRTTSHRIAMMRNMVTSLFEHGRITTTDAKAKELRPVAEKLITLGKRGDLHAIRLAASYIRDKKIVTRLFTTIAPQYKDRPGGYTRIVKLGYRTGDTAPLSVIELVTEVCTPRSRSNTKSVKQIQSDVTSTSISADESPKTSIQEPVDTCEAVTD